MVCQYTYYKQNTKTENPDEWKFFVLKIFTILKKFGSAGSWYFGKKALRRILIDVQAIIEKSDISLIGSATLYVPEWNFARNLWLSGTVGRSPIISHNI